MSGPGRVDQNEGVTAPRPCHSGDSSFSGRIEHVRRHWLFLFAVVALIGCDAGVNQELLATSTPYPIRSPVAAALAAASPEADVVEALATGEAALAAGDLDVAEAAYYRAILAAPEQIDAYLARAEVGERQAEFEAAAADYGRVIALEPGNVEAYVGRGNLALLQAQGDPARYQAALDDFNRALALDADNQAARLGRARLFLDRASFRGDPTDLDRALAELDALGERAASAAANLLRARVLAARGDVAGARDVLAAPVVSAATDVRVDEADREVARAAVAVAGRDWAEAATAAAAALRADPSRWEVYRFLAEAELGRGDAAAALSAAERLLARWPEDGASLYLRGLALIELGRREEAEEALAAARDRLKASPVYQARIAQVLQARPQATPQPVAAVRG